MKRLRPMTTRVLPGNGKGRKLRSACGGTACGWSLPCPVKPMNQPLLHIRDLRVRLRTARGDYLAVDGADLSLDRGERLGVVGESGCGKTMLALALLGLTPSPPGEVRAREMTFMGRDLTALSRRESRSLRGASMAMIFQEPMTALNPVLRVGAQVVEGLRAHEPLTRIRAGEKARNLLRAVGLDDAGRVMASFPHELSGGMRQRVVIAMALACDPVLILADEPTTALDATVQARILDLLDAAVRERGAALLLISHDLAVVAGYCDRVLVMYAGCVVESAPAADLFARPLHPYAAGLLDSLPDPRAGRARQRLRAIPGSVPDPALPPPGCAFHPRCPRVLDLCRLERPPLFEADQERRVRCWLYGRAAVNCEQ